MFAWSIWVTALQCGYSPVDCIRRSRSNERTEA
jgi:hypothetical protein